MTAEGTQGLGDAGARTHHATPGAEILERVPFDVEAVSQNRWLQADIGGRVVILNADRIKSLIVLSPSRD